MNHGGITRVPSVALTTTTVSNSYLYIETFGSLLLGGRYISNHWCQRRLNSIIIIIIAQDKKIRLKQTLIGRAAAGVGWSPPSISAPTPRPPEYLSDHRTLAQVPTPQQYLFREGKTREGKTREFSIARKTPRCRSEDYSANLQKLSSLRGKRGPRESLRRDFGLTLNRVLLNNYDSLRENRQGHEPPTVSVRESPSGEITIMVRVRSLTGVFATIVQRGIWGNTRRCGLGD